MSYLHFLRIIKDMIIKRTTHVRHLLSVYIYRVMIRIRTPYLIHVDRLYKS